MSVSRLLSVISLIFCTAFLLQAEEPASFNGEITVTATGVKEESKDLPVPVTVISSEEIQDSQQSDLPELLRRVPGVIVMSSGGTGGVTSVFTRGTESDHTLVMFDGVRLNSPYFGGYDFSQLSTAGIERIEVIRGPYSALWGSDAVGGVVNLLPRRAGEGFHGAIFGEGGSDSWERWEGSVAWAHRGFDIYASGLKRKGDNGLDNSDFDLETGLVDTGWSFGDKSRIGLLYHQVDSELGIPFTSPGNPSPLRRQDVRQKTFAMPLSWNINPSWQLDVTASRVERDFRFSDPDDSWGFTSQHTNADTSEFRAVAHRRAGAHMLSFGGEWRRDEVSDRSSYGVNLDGKDLDTTGLIAQDDWKISKKIRLLLSARWDDTSEWGSRFSPRASLGWAFAENFGMRFSYGEAFRQPSLGELYFPGSGNPELKPTTGWKISGKQISTVSSLSSVLLSSRSSPRPSRSAGSTRKTARERICSGDRNGAERSRFTAHSPAGCGEISR